MSDQSEDTSSGADELKEILPFSAPPPGGDAARGKQLTIICIAIALTVSVLGLAISFGTGTAKVSSIIREVLIIGLCFAVYTGHNWARIVLGGLALLGAVLGLLGVFSGLGSFVVVFSLLFAAIYGFIGVMMFVSNDIKRFQYEQREARAERKRTDRVTPAR